MNGENGNPRSRRSARIVFVLACLLATAPALSALAAPYPTTRRDFELPGTQPMTVTANFAPPSACSPCHSNYGQPNVEPVSYTHLTLPTILRV